MIFCRGLVCPSARVLVTVRLFILQPFLHFTYVTAHSTNFRQFTYVTTHSPTFPSLHLHHNSFSNLTVTSPTSQLILQPFCYFTYVTTHSPTFPLLHLRHSSSSYRSNLFDKCIIFCRGLVCPSARVLVTVRLFILQPFRHFTYVTAHSPTLLSLLLRHLASRPLVQLYP